MNYQHFAAEMSTVSHLLEDMLRIYILSFVCALILQHRVRAPTYERYFGPVVGRPSGSPHNVGHLYGIHNPLIPLTTMPVTRYQDNPCID